MISDARGTVRMRRARTSGVALPMNSHEKGRGAGNRGTRNNIDSGCSLPTDRNFREEGRVGGNSSMGE